MLFLRFVPQRKNILKRCFTRLYGYLKTWTTGLCEQDTASIDWLFYWRVVNSKTSIRDLKNILQMMTETRIILWLSKIGSSVLTGTASFIFNINSKNRVTIEDSTLWPPLTRFVYGILAIIFTIFTVKSQSRSPVHAKVDLVKAVYTALVNIKRRTTW